MKKLLVLSVAMSLAATGTAFAQARSSAREDNIWGGYAHQPTQAEVTQQEKSFGVAPPQQQQQQTANDDVEKMYQNLMRETDQGQ